MEFLAPANNHQQLIRRYSVLELLTSAFLGEANGCDVDRIRHTYCWPPLLKHPVSPRPTVVPPSCVYLNSLKEKKDLSTPRSMTV